MAKPNKILHNLPFFMLDVNNYQLITTSIVPSDISDTKEIFYSEIPVPGKNYQPVSIGGGGNRKLSFSLDIINRNNTVGNLTLIKQIEMLRNQSVGLSVFSTGQFTPYPKVLFNWGIGSIPLLYYVKKADMTHKQHFTNAVGNPQYTTVDFELWLDEDNILYKGEEIYRRLSSIAGMVTGISQVKKQQQGRRPY